MSHSKQGPRFTLSAVGVDRPGIVAAVTGALMDEGCNLQDSTMTILQGHFAILLVVQAPPGATAAGLEAALSEVARRFELVVAVRELSETPPKPHAQPADEPEPWTLAVLGADRPGIVHKVAKALADAGANIVDLSTHLVGDEEEPVYVMTLIALLPTSPPGAEAVAIAVRQAAEALGVHCTVHRDEPEVL